ncbi:FAD-dependent oxidoreductase [Candidatus Sumerlaeota bacterium]|nr:FAD-dependent oxidoreductase [Candidatus Sumerlaeota bacterium]
MISRQRLVVIGGTAAGASAAAKARRVNGELEIVVLEKSGFVSYGSCGLPYLISGVVPNHHRLIARTPEEFSRGGIQVRTRNEVTQIDTQRRVVEVRDLERDVVFELAFGRLIVASGAAALRPSVAGGDLQGIFTLRTIEDGLAIQRWLAHHHPRRAVVVGGGYIGLEMAEAFRARGLEVFVVEMLPHLMPNIDADMSTLIREELERQGVTVSLGNRVEGFVGTDRVGAVRTQEGDIPTEVVMLGIGVRPNVTLAQSAGLALGPTGALSVDDHQRTGVQGVFAAGDVVESKHVVTGKPAYVPLGSTANKQGRVAGINAAGGDAHFSGIVGTAVVKVFDLEVARTGLSEGEARREGYVVRTTKIGHPSAGHYMPDPTPLHVKLIYEDRTERLLGAQMVGRRGAAKRIDVLAAALHGGWTLEEVSRLDLGYAPPFAPVWDPILVACNVARQD